jgi:hypothetical protein
MRSISTLFVLIIFITPSLFSQGLLPSINSGILPNNSDPICSTPYYLNTDFDTSGYNVGETVNDFTLFDVNGNSYQLSNILNLGKPVLLVTGSLTCPVFRNQLPTINTVFTTYAADINTSIIYVIEAHPTDTSPYFGDVHVTTQNMNQGVLFPQPNTYAERKALVDTLLQNYPVVPPVYIDGPCNEYWHHFGPAPQNAYLIDTNGVVMVKHGWFDQFPRNIYCDIDSALGISSGNCSSGSTNGTFIFNPFVTTVYGSPGETIYGTGELVNNSANDVLILVMKIQENYALDWESSFCMGLCYSNTTDSTTILLAANDTMQFSLDFHTSGTPDSSAVRVGFRNVNMPSNQFSQWFFGNTAPVGLENFSTSSILVYPNPAEENLNISISPGLEDLTLRIFDIRGKLVYNRVRTSNTDPFQINVQDLDTGMYILEISSKSIFTRSRFIKK